MDGDNSKRKQEEPIRSERAKPIQLGLGCLIFAIILTPWSSYQLVVTCQEVPLRLADLLYPTIGLTIGIGCLVVLIRLVKRKGLRAALSEGEWM